MLDEALLVATEAHKGQTRWDKKTPYINHPIAVVECLKDMGVTNNDILCAGYLHDVLEDTDYSESELECKFGSNVLKIVEELTHKSDINDLEYLIGINNMHMDAKIVKFADIIVNLGDWSHGKHFYTKRAEALKSIFKEFILLYEDCR